MEYIIVFKSDFSSNKIKIIALIFLMVFIFLITSSFRNINFTIYLCVSKLYTVKIVNYKISYFKKQ